MLKPDISHKIFLFINDKTKVPMHKIKMESSLLRDFGVDGDDARDFILAYAEQFLVDIERFKFYDYFKN